MSNHTIIKQKKAIANGTNRIKKGANQLILLVNPLILLVRPARFERAAYGLEDRKFDFPSNDFNKLRAFFSRQL